MICENCKKKKATVHMTEVINNKVTERHLCQECAQKLGHTEVLDEIMKPNFSINDLLAGLSSIDVKMGNGMAAEPVEKMVCEKCGMNFRDFSKVGRFGCGNCYTAFREHVDPLVRRIHGSGKHSGKVSKLTGTEWKTKEEVRKLKIKLRKLVEKEEYEEAAKLRDEIKRVEKEETREDGR